MRTVSGAAHHPWGRVRERLAARLRDLGFAVHDLWAAQGYPRAPRGLAGEYDDCWRWEGRVQRPGEPTLSIVSYDTMTACARHGVAVERDGCFYEAHALTPANAQEDRTMKCPEPGLRDRGGYGDDDCMCEPCTAPALPSPAMTTKDKVANFRTTSARLAAYTAAAERCDMSLSEWLDHVAAAAAGKSDLLRDLDRARRHAAKLERAKR